MKKLIPALCMLLIAAAMLGTSTYAWFSMNKTVTATGMKVKATTAESLVIAKTPTVGTDYTVNLNQATAVELTPSTHDSTYATYTTGLKYVKNPEYIKANTGYIDGAEYDYGDAVNATVNYYVDYTVYVASSGAAMTSKTLTFGFDDVTKAAIVALADDGSEDTSKAISVDVYMDTVTKASPAAFAASASNYVGTIAFKEAGTDTVAKENISIPATSGTDVIRVTMRVFLDGALEKASGQAYVYNDKIDTSDRALGVAISVSTYVAP